MEVRYTEIPTVKPIFFACPLFHEFRNLCDFAKITDREYSKSHRYCQCQSSIYIAHHRESL